jgi:NADH-quinone oxidoreductase subunit N
MDSAFHSSLIIIAPEMLLAASAMALMVFGAFAGDKSGSAIGLLSVIALGGAIFLLLGPGAGRGEAFGGSFIADDFSVFVKTGIYSSAALALLMAQGFLKAEKIHRFEYYGLALLSAAGMGVMVSARDLIVLYMGLETQSLALYVLAAFKRDDAKASEAGLKYFMLGALSSGLLLFGASLVYGFVGSTRFTEIAAFASKGDIGILFGLVLVICGVAFKCSAAPFHMWTPDVYEGAPTSTTAFFAAAPKFAAVAVFARLLFEPFASLTEDWRQIVVVISLLSMTVGAFGALTQNNIKRLLAYSSIGNVGYALMALAAGPGAGAASLLFYMAIYVATTLGMFGAALLMRRQGQAFDQVDDLAGLSQTKPWLALCLTILMFSVAGVPPFAGFFGKWEVFKAAVDAQLTWLAVYGALASVVSAYYYLRVIKVMWFDSPKGAFDKSSFGAALVVLAAAIVVAPGILFLGWLELAADIATRQF